MKTKINIAINIFLILTASFWVWLYVLIGIKSGNMTVKDFEKLLWE